MQRELLLEEEIQRLLRQNGESVPLPEQADTSYLVVADYLHQGAVLLGHLCLRAKAVPRVASLPMNEGKVASSYEPKFYSHYWVFLVRQEALQLLPQLWRPPVAALSGFACPPVKLLVQ